MTQLAASMAPFTETATIDPISLTKGDLNKALFKGGHYIDGENFKGQNVSVKTDTNDKKLKIDVELYNAAANPKISLTFAIHDNCLTLENGVVSKNNINEPVQSARRLAEVLKCIYKHVRAEVDPKWVAQYRQVAMDRLEISGPKAMIIATEQTGVMPTFKIEGGRIDYQAPKIGRDKICDGQCGRCRLSGLSV